MDFRYSGKNKFARKNQENLSTNRYLAETLLSRVFLFLETGGGSWNLLDIGHGPGAGLRKGRRMIARNLQQKWTE